MTSNSSRILRIVVAAIFMATAANCFLKYLWWTACYSAWSGIPKMAAQWKAAGANASFNGWSFLALEAVGIVVLFSLIRLRPITSSDFFRSGVRLVASVSIAAVTTAAFALALSWVKQGGQ